MTDEILKKDDKSDECVWVTSGDTLPSNDQSTSGVWRAKDSFMLMHREQR